MSLAHNLAPLAQAQPGMVLSEALLDRQGQVLLPKGAVLTAPMLASLERHGVEMLPLQGASQAAAPEDPAALQARLDQLFRKNDRDDTDDWATGILRRYVEDYRFGREVAP